MNCDHTLSRAFPYDDMIVRVCDCGLAEEVVAVEDRAPYSTAAGCLTLLVVCGAIWGGVIYGVWRLVRFATG